MDRLLEGARVVALERITYQPSGLVITAGARGTVTAVSGTGVVSISWDRRRHMTIETPTEFLALLVPAPEVA